jgi:hypothetical protein
MFFAIIAASGVTLLKLERKGLASQLGQSQRSQTKSMEIG